MSAPRDGRGAPPPPRRLRVLAVTEHFLPGFRCGGPVRSLSNLVRLLAEEAEFAVLNRNHDAFETAPYPDVASDAWVVRDGIAVRYVSPGGMSAGRLREALHERDYDVLYLNSLWSVFSRRLLLLRRLGRLPDRPVVLAPRGELAAGALRLKAKRKLAYLAVARAAGLLRGITWQATSEAEVGQIRSWIGPRTPVFLAPNPSLPNGGAALPRPPKEPGTLRLVYLSRLSESKNLLGALEALRGVEGEVIFDVYGIREAEKYWERCQAAMAALPPNVRCAYHGPVPHEQVEATLAGYHVFILPTFSESFGHAVVEALRAGCPPLISDRTPWRGLAEARAGWDVPLDDVEAMQAALRQAVEMDDAEWRGWAEGARGYAASAVAVNDVRDAYLRLFHHATGWSPATRPGRAAAA